MYFTYVLKSQKDGKYYIGQTDDLEKRISRHNSGGVPATRKRRPLELICMIESKNRAEAMKIEKYLKSLKGGNVFKKIICAAV